MGTELHAGLSRQGAHSNHYCNFKVPQRALGLIACPLTHHLACLPYCLESYIDMGIFGAKLSFKCHSDYWCTK